MPNLFDNGHITAEVKEGPKPEYRFEVKIVDETMDETVINGSTYLGAIHVDSWGLISCESAEQEVFGVLRAFEKKIRAEYEKENYSSNDEEEL